MTEQTTSPAAQPIQDKAPKPPGLMPKNIQAWVMLSLAVLMVIIMWLTGGKKPRTASKSGAPNVQTSAPLEVNQAKIADRLVQTLSLWTRPLFASHSPSQAAC